MPTYNKLVRDRIPEIIANSGKGYRAQVLSEDEYIKELQKKSIEELNEYLSSASDQEAIEELADVLEILHALAKLHGSSFAEVEAIRKAKAEKRGSFNERIFLVDVEG